MSRRTTPLLAGGAAGVALLVGLLTPATHGTFSASLGAEGTAALTPFLTCAAAAQDERARGDLVFAYPLSDPVDAEQAADVSGGAGAADYSGARATTRPTQGGCARDGATAWAPDGATSGLTTPGVVLEHAFTFEIRFRTRQASAVIASITPQGTDQTYSLAVVDGAAALLAPGGQPVLRGGPVADDGTWHHLALVVEEDALRLYVDSADVASQPFRLAGRFGATWRLAIGGPDGQRLPLFQGALVWAQLMNRPLTAAEVHAHDLAGRAPALPGRVRPPKTQPVQTAPEAAEAPADVGRQEAPTVDAPDDQAAEQAEAPAAASVETQEGAAG